MEQKIELGGVPISVVDDEKAEEAHFVICMLEKDANDLGMFTDNVSAICGVCGGAISHRPYMPKKPMKVCLPCALVLMARDKRH